MSDFYGFPDAKGKKKRKIQELRILVLELRDKIYRKDELIRNLLSENHILTRQKADHWKNVERNNV